MSKGPETRDVGLSGIAVLPRRMRGLRPEVIDELAKSMAANGLLQPIVIRPAESIGHYLIAGRHRLEAARKLKWDSIRCSIVNGLEADAALLAEIDENLIRADLTLAERAAHVAARKPLYEKLHPETKRGGRPGKRTGKGGKYKSQNETSTFVADTAKKTRRGRSSVARDVHRGENIVVLPEITGTCLDTSEQLDALAKLPHDEQRQLAERAKAGEKVDAKSASKKRKRQQRELELGDKITALPEKRYGVIYADPPWKFEPYSDDTGMDRAADNHYPTMDTEAIKRLAVPAASDCVLFLWATVPMLDVAIDVLKAWGFTYKSNFVWTKDKAGTGFWNKNKHEHLLIGVRGSIPAPAPGEQYESAFTAPRGKHSAKPFAVHEMIETMFPTLPRIELFARERFEGWDAWGNELQEAAE